MNLAMLKKDSTGCFYKVNLTFLVTAFLIMMIVPSCQPEDESSTQLNSAEQDLDLCIWRNVTAATNYATPGYGGTLDLGSYSLSAGTTFHVGTAGMGQGGVTGDTFLRLVDQRTGLTLAVNDDCCSGLGSSISVVIPYSGNYRLYMGCFANSYPCGGAVCSEQLKNSMGIPEDPLYSYNTISNNGYTEGHSIPIYGVSPGGQTMWGAYGGFDSCSSDCAGRHFQGIVRIPKFLNLPWDFVHSSSASYDTAGLHRNLHFYSIGSKTISDGPERMWEQGTSDFFETTVNYYDYDSSRQVGTANGVDDHLGGIGLTGRYLFVPAEKKDGAINGKIRVYDLNIDPPQLLYTLYQNQWLIDKGAATVAVRIMGSWTHDSTKNLNSVLRSGSNNNARGKALLVGHGKLSGGPTILHFMTKAPDVNGVVHLENNNAPEQWYEGSNYFWQDGSSPKADGGAGNAGIADYQVIDLIQNKDGGVYLVGFASPSWDWVDLWRIYFSGDSVPAYSWQNNGGSNTICNPSVGNACLAKVGQIHMGCGSCGCDYCGATGAYIYPQGNKYNERLIVYSSHTCPGHDYTLYYPPYRDYEPYHNVCEF